MTKSNPNTELKLEVTGERLEQMKLVERAVRPVRASSSRKWKMREELLSHVSCLYDEEFSRLGDAKAAMEAASRRFGDPGELSREFQHSLPMRERWFYLLQRILPRRGPKESEVRYSARVAAYESAVILVFVGAFITWLYLWAFPGETDLVRRNEPPDDSLWTILRWATALVLSVYAHLFSTNLLLVRMCEAVWGMTGTQRTKAILKCAMVSGVTCSAILFAFRAALEWKLDRAIAHLPGLIPLAVYVGGVYYLLARLDGQRVISGRVWASLDIETEG